MGDNTCLLHGPRNYIEEFKFILRVFRKIHSPMASRQILSKRQGQLLQYCEVQVQLSVDGNLSSRKIYQLSFTIKGGNIINVTVTLKRHNHTMISSLTVLTAYIQLKKKNYCKVTPIYSLRNIGKSILGTKKITT